MKLDQIDLAFLHLAASNNGRFNEQDLAKSDLAYLGVGRTLDRLADLKEKNLIRLDGESFSITDTARHILWDKNTTLQTRILRLLQIKSFEELDIVKYLLESPESVQEKIEELRKQGFLIFTTIKKDDRMIRVCEMTQEGNDYIQVQSLDIRAQLQKSLDDLARKIQNSKIDDAKIKTVLEKVRTISTELD
ncbi:MAG: hypothetical protein QXN55_04720 [Candidatus Nitrosotenuis sp.]|jgi:hypothetical protein